MSPDPPGLFAEGFAGLRWHRQLRKSLKKFSCLSQQLGSCGGPCVLYESRHNFFFLGSFLVDEVEATQRSLLSRRKYLWLQYVKTVAVSGIDQGTNNRQRPETLVGQFPEPSTYLLAVFGPVKKPERRCGTDKWNQLQSTKAQPCRALQWMLACDRPSEC